jgi:hypothetical protein
MSSSTASIARRLAAVNSSDAFPSQGHVTGDQINKMNHYIDFID